VISAVRLIFLVASFAETGKTCRVNALRGVNFAAQSRRFSKKCLKTDY
jgi:hypothetical protein